METPKITEIKIELEPVEHDPFIDDLGKIAIKGVDTDTDLSYNENITER